MEFLNGRSYLYTIDISYVEELYKVDKEVFFERNSDYENKPYIGIIIVLNKYKYFIPLTSAKSKHLNWHNVTDTNYVIYEFANSGLIKPDWVWRPIKNTDNVKHILSVLEIKKMIPVPDGKYYKMELDFMSDENRKNLLLKEYNFLKPLKPDILEKAAEIYSYQIDSGDVREFHCNFKKLEAVHDGYIVKTT